MPPKLSLLYLTSTTSLCWPGPSSTCPTASPGICPGLPATTPGTQVGHRRLYHKKCLLLLHVQSLIRWSQVSALLLVVHIHIMATCGGWRQPVGPTQLVLTIKVYLMHRNRILNRHVVVSHRRWTLKTVYFLFSSYCLQNDWGDYHDKFFYPSRQTLITLLIAFYSSNTLVHDQTPHWLSHQLWFSFLCNDTKIMFVNNCQTLSLINVSRLPLNCYFVYLMVISYNFRKSQKIDIFSPISVKCYPICMRQRTMGSPNYMLSWFILILSAAIAVVVVA